MDVLLFKTMDFKQKKGSATIILGLNYFSMGSSQPVTLSL
jgi:hypothetical protein